MLNRAFASAHYFLGFRAIKRGKWDRAVSHLSEVIRFLPSNPIALSDRGLAYQGAGDHRLAVRDFDRAIELAPNLAVAFYNRGISAKILGDYDWAVADHAKAIALNPTDSAAYGEQGVAYTCKHEYDRAIASLGIAKKLAPSEPSHPKHRGYALFHLGDFAASAADLRQSLNREADPYAMLFCYLARARSGEDAAEQLQADSRRLRKSIWPFKAVELFLGSQEAETLFESLTYPEERAEAHFYVGQWHLLRARREEAITHLQEAMKQCPTLFVEHTGAAAELRRLGCL